VQARLDGFERPWWIAGGWAIEAFTGVPRPHHDVDVAIFRRDVPALRAGLGARSHLWAIGSGRMQLMDEDVRTLPRWASQVWVREHAQAPWQLDVLLNPGSVTGWVFKHDPSFVRPLDDVTWRAPDGLRYLRPELVLAHKVKLVRPKDDLDLAATVPLLGAPERVWLASYAERVAPRHPWLAALRGSGSEQP
jgi:hypothetical protein